MTPAAIRITRHLGSLELSLHYSPTDVEAIRSVPGRRWDGERRVWTVPDRPAIRAQLQGLFGARLVGMDVTADPAPTARSADPNPIDPAPAPPIDLLEAFRQELVARGLRPRTRNVYLAHVRSFLRWSQGGHSSSPPPWAQRG